MVPTTPRLLRDEKFNRLQRCSFCSRYKDGAKSPDDTPVRAFGTKCSL